MSNSDNPYRGKKFQEAVCEWFASKPEYKGSFEMEVGLPIGSPEKNHFFDIVNKESKIVIECKRYTWTETGNVPSAKILALSEVAFNVGYSWPLAVRDSRNTQGNKGSDHDDYRYRPRNDELSFKHL